MPKQSSELAVSAGPLVSSHSTTTYFATRCRLAPLGARAQLKRSPPPARTCLSCHAGHPVLDHSMLTGLLMVRSTGTACKALVSQNCLNNQTLCVCSTQRRLFEIEPALLQMQLGQCKAPNPKQSAQQTPVLSYTCVGSELPSKLRFRSMSAARLTFNRRH